MGAAKDHPRYNVVSLRVSDKDREALDDYARKTRRSVSELMREAMELLKLKMERHECH